MTLVKAAFGESSNFVTKVNLFWKELFVEYDDKTSSHESNTSSDSSHRVESLPMDENEFPLLTRFRELVAQSSANSNPKKTEIEFRARRVLEDTRASLNSDTVEALLCVKDWLPTLEGEGDTFME
ncbi:unnamed protein product [Cuscuta campestris]|uniref:HAT C-terminal dimerisation domain-containing protein n=1 Tax=Cuscuta campestris TaxID=132261 RepID=A0A484L3E3_9ASTE|nr:unnamed protein product [Cuscuta campestris]